MPQPGGDPSKLPGLGGEFNPISLNTYHYAGNNPLKYVDPMGMEIEAPNENDRAILQKHINSISTDIYKFDETGKLEKQKISGLRRFFRSIFKSGSYSESIDKGIASEEKIILNISEDILSVDFNNGSIDSISVENSGGGATSLVLGYIFLSITGRNSSDKIEIEDGTMRTYSPQEILMQHELQIFANEVEMEISVCHFPPGTSKWKKIEHRMISYITKNWRGRPLETRETVVQLIANTKTKPACHQQGFSFRIGV